MQGDGRSSAAIHTSNRDGCVSNVKFGNSPQEGRVIRLRHCPKFPDSQNFIPSLLSRPRIPQNTGFVFSGVKSVEIFYASSHVTVSSETVSPCLLDSAWVKITLPITWSAIRAGIDLRGALGDRCLSILVGMSYRCLWTRQDSARLGETNRMDRFPE
jgi:hypothetical protein